MRPFTVQPTVGLTPGTSFAFLPAMRTGHEQIRRVLGAFALSCCACDRTDEVREYLEEQGYVDVSVVQRDGGGFDVRARQGEDHCEGTVSITGWIEREIQQAIVCVPKATVSAPAETSAAATPTEPVAWGELLTYPAERLPSDLPRITAGQDLGSRAAVTVIQALLAHDRVWLVERCNQGLRERLDREELIEVTLLLQRMGALVLESPRTTWNGDRETIAFDVDHSTGEPGMFQLELEFAGRELAGVTVRGTTIATAMDAMTRERRPLRLFDAFVTMPGMGMQPSTTLAAGTFDAWFAFDGLAVTDENGKRAIDGKAKAWVVGPDGKKRKVEPTYEGLWRGFISVRVRIDDPQPGAYAVRVELLDVPTKRTATGTLDIDVR